MAMSSDCENVSAQMMELLYGELPADARASVDAHVAGCARCRGELAGFEKTRALARQGLDEAPPARAHAAIMAAAAAHLAAQAQPAARKPVAPEKVSFWDRVRARWAFPTFATVGALAVFVLANRVFLNPERTLQRPPAAEPAEAPAPGTQTGAARPDPMPAPQPPAASAPQPEPASASSSKPERFAQQAQAGARARPGTKMLADMPAGEKKPAAGKRDYADPFEGLDSGGAGEKRGGAKKAKKEEGGRGTFAEPPPPAMAAPPADKMAEQQRQQRIDRRFAPPPPPREEEAPRPKAAAPVARTELSKEADAVSSRAAAPAKPATPAPSKSTVDLLRGDSDRSATVGGAGKGRAVGSLAGPGQAGGFGSGAAEAAPMPAPARNKAPRPAAAAPAPAPASTIAETAPPPPPAAPVTASKPRAKRINAAPAADDGQETALDSEAKDEKKQSDGKAKPNEALLLRADRLFAEGRWTEAAAVYRELLRRDPRNDDAERWRRRLVAAETAEVSEKHNADLAQRREAEAARARKAAPAKAAKAPAKAASGAAAE
jgi:hypothetical protein